MTNHNILELLEATLGANIEAEGVEFDRSLAELAW
jgi:hypothetical protein